MNKFNLLAMMILLPTFVLAGRSIKCVGVDAERKVVGAEINDIQVDSAYGHAALGSPRKRVD